MDASASEWEHLVGADHFHLGLMTAHALCNIRAVHMSLRRSVIEQQQGSREPGAGFSQALHQKDLARLPRLPHPHALVDRMLCDS